MSAPITRCGWSLGKVILRNYQACKSVPALTLRSVPREACSQPTQQVSSLLRHSSNGYYTRAFCTSSADNSKKAKQKSVQSNITTTEDQPEPDTLYKTIHLEIKSSDVEVMKSYVQFLQMAANELEICIENIDPPHRKKFHANRLTLLKSAFVHKKHRVQYEIRTHYAQITLKRLTGSTASVFLEYLQRNLPEGVAMKVTKHELRRLPGHLKPPEEAAQISISG